MRTITDRAGQRWEVAEVAGFGVGARAIGAALPLPTEVAICFRSGDERVGCPALAGALDEMSDAELLALLESNQPR